MSKAKRSVCAVCNDMIKDDFISFEGKQFCCKACSDVFKNKKVCSIWRK